MNKSSKIYIAGHRGLVGSAIERKLRAEGYNNIVTATSKEIDLRNKEETRSFFQLEKPEYVFFTAAKAGGVLALSTFKVQSMLDNLMIQNNVISSSYEFGVKKLLFLGSNCMYPRLAVEPLNEDYILSGKLEPTTEFYALAKLAGLKLCQAYNEQYGCNFITAIPVNLYGKNDKDDLQTAHVMAALLRKFKEAKDEVEIWGIGNQRREFMHADDLADACLFLMLNYNESRPINVGAGQDVSIKELAALIALLTGFKGRIVFNKDKPDGIKSKLLDSTKINQLGWHRKIKLDEGIKMCL